MITLAPTSQLLRLPTPSLSRFAQSPPSSLLVLDHFEINFGDFIHTHCN